MELREFQKETAEQMKAMGVETDRRLQETAEQMNETSRQMKETDKRVGELTGRFGDIVEHMVVPNLVARFQDLGFAFTKVSRNVKITDEQKRVIAEIDALLENGDFTVSVEIKSKPRIEYINDHIERMEKLKNYADSHNDKRKYLGAVAGVAFDDSVKTYALKNGFYVLEPSGETFTITRPQDRGYTPREW
jgi:methyl-accepting chemotaxis protein